MRVADALALSLESIGVKKIFSVTGGASGWLNDGVLVSSKIETVFCHHEQAAVFAAEGYARASGSLGVALVTIGPGATNAITGVAGAFADSIPVLLISGQSFTSQTIGSSGCRQIGIQEVDVLPLIASITKDSHSLRPEDDLIEVFDRLLQACMTGRPGPVWLEIPADVQKMSVEEHHSVFTHQQPLSSEVEQVPNLWINDVVSAIQTAERPLVHLGHGIRLSGAIEDALSFLEEHQLPFIVSHNAVDLCPTDHPLRVGMSGIFGNRAANFALAKCDVYLAIGTRVGLAQTGYRPDRYCAQADCFAVDIDVRELNKAWLSDWTVIQSDARKFLNQISVGLPSECVAPQGWIEDLKGLRSEFPPVLPEVYEDEKEGYVQAYLLHKALSKHSPRETTFVTDMGLAYQSTMQVLPLQEGQRLFTNTGLAPMGWGLPGAIGSSCFGHRRTVCLTGDGGLMMNLQELATLAEEELPVVVIVFNNGGYLTILQSQQLAFEGRIQGVDKSTGLRFPNFCLLANSFGIQSQQVSNLDTFEETYSKALKINGPYLIDVKMNIDQIQGPKAVNRIAADGSYQQTPLEDLWPFLPEDVLQRILDNQSSPANKLQG